MGTTPLAGVVVNMTLAGVPVAVQRAFYSLVTTAANNLTSKGVGMYPDALPDPSDTIRFPEGQYYIQVGF
jgi:hypothetical protein